MSAPRPGSVRVTGRSRAWLAAYALLAAGCSAPSHESGFVERTLMWRGVPRPYQVWVPPAYSRQHRWPVILFLHGSGERGTDGRRQIESGMGPALLRFPERYPAIVVFPQAQADERWPGDAAAFALATLDHARKEFRVDRRREYVIGVSMGGNGAWYLAYRFPERFAAIVSICGWFVPRDDEPTSEPVVPARDGPPDAALARRVAHLPIWIVHGDSDPIIPPDDSRRIGGLLASLHAPARYTELKNTGHDAWDPAFADPELPAWLFTQRRRH